MDKDCQKAWNEYRSHGTSDLPVKNFKAGFKAGKTTDVGESGSLGGYGWTSVDDALPDETPRYELGGYDVAVGGERFTDISFKNGAFQMPVFDHEDDFDYETELKGVTHWVRVPEVPQP